MSTQDDAFDFWALPRKDVLGESMTRVYDDMCARLRRDLESHNGGTVDTMIAERVAFLYCWIRDTESRLSDAKIVDRGGLHHPEDVRKNPFEGQKNYKEINQLWLQMAVELRRTTSGLDLAEAQRGYSERILELVMDIAIESYGKPAAKALKDRIKLALTEEGLV